MWVQTLNSLRRQAVLRQPVSFFRFEVGPCLIRQVYDTIYGFSIRERHPSRGLDQFAAWRGPIVGAISDLNSMSDDEGK